MSEKTGIQVKIINLYTILPAIKALAIVAIFLSPVAWIWLGFTIAWKLFISGLWVSVITTIHQRKYGA